MEWNQRNFLTSISFSFFYFFFFLSVSFPLLSCYLFVSFPLLDELLKKRRKTLFTPNFFLSFLLLPFSCASLCFRFLSFSSALVFSPFPLLVMFRFFFSLQVSERLDQQKLCFFFSRLLFFLFLNVPSFFSSFFCSTHFFLPFVLISSPYFFFFLFLFL